MSSPEAVSTPAQPPLFEATPPRRWAFVDLRELWEFRDLVYFMARRDIAVRYKQTAVGVLWVVLQPVAFAAIFSFFLGLVFRAESDIAPYPVLVLSGMTLWIFWVATFSRCSDSTVGASNLISKLYFPRVIIPLAATVPPLLDLVAAFAVLIVALLAFGITPELKVLAVPGVVLLTFGLALGIGLWFSALAVRYRDIQQLVPFMVQLLLFSSPVFYTADLVPAAVRPFYALNPLVGALESFRWAVLPNAPPPSALALGVSSGVALLLVLTGLVYFQRAQAEFADVI